MMMGRECTILIRRTGRDGPRSPHGEWAETHRDVLLRKPERVRTHQDIWDGTVGTHWDIPQPSSRFLDCLPKAACRRYRTPLFWEFCRSIYFWGFIRNSLLRETFSGAFRSLIPSWPILIPTQNRPSIQVPSVNPSVSGRASLLNPYPWSYQYRICCR